MIIREAMTEDLKTMALLWRMMVKEVRPGSEMNTEWWLNFQKELMGTEVYRAYVAIECGEMVGYAVGMIYPDALTGKVVAFGQDIYIMPECRNDKVVGNMYGKLVRLGKEKGAKAIEMLCFESQLEMWKNKGYNVHTYHVRREI
ncbi:MAG: GNAT family N-acetyltransferase [Deltaproteobacteria bacterium]|nr:GNAT family N-acetyltransferase [Deltaproteobacteria bacterium]